MNEKMNNMTILNFIGLSHKHTAISAMGHNHYGAVLIARPFILLLKHHGELHRDVGVVVQVFVECRTKVVESLDEVGTNVITQFAIFGKTVVLILIEPTTETSVELLYAARCPIAVERGDFLHALGKSMINSLVQNSALELASYGIRINAVAPSFVESGFRKDAMSEIKNNKYLEQMRGFHLLNQKLTTPEEIADVILFLASNDAIFMTGEIINVDCGYELNHDLSFLQKDEINKNDFEENYNDNININNNYFFNFN